MMGWRKKLYRVIEVAEENDWLSRIYDIFMMAVIVASIVPLTIKNASDVVTYVDCVTVAIFIIDYILRIITADYKLERGKISFILYPFTPMALIDLISILPSITVLNSGLRLLKIVRLVRTFRVFRVFKAARYSKNVIMIINVFKRQKESLLAVCGLAFIYILVSALVVFNVEPETFTSFFDAMYWATVSLTTVGYGDIYAVSTAGKIITMLSSIFGIAVVALPAGIVTAGYMEELARNNEDNSKEG
jgi:voltage-gated potassium channel